MSMATPEERLSWLDAAVVVDEKLHGPLPDVVYTQGHYLKPRPNTPVYERRYDPQFIEKLEFYLDGLLFIQKLRRRKYGNDAEEWPPSHTPVELKERWEAEQEVEDRKIQALLEIPTPEDELPVWEVPLTTTKKRNLDNISPTTPPRKRRPHSSSCSSPHDRNRCIEIRPMRRRKPTPARH